MWEKLAVTVCCTKKGFELGDVFRFLVPGGWHQSSVSWAGLPWLRRDVPRMAGERSTYHILVSHQLLPDETEQLPDSSDGQ